MQNLQNNGQSGESTPTGSFPAALQLRSRHNQRKVLKVLSVL